jgi:hypothetical protein
MQRTYSTSSDYLKDHHPHYRQPTIRKLYDAIRSLKELPRRGRTGREEGTREIRFPPLPRQTKMKCGYACRS